MTTAKTISLAEVWNEILAPKFIRFRQVLVSGAEPHGRRAMALFSPQPGHAAVDIGCGFGDATSELAELVGPSGTALGLDLAPAFIALARAATQPLKLAQLRFLVEDAATYAAPESADYLFARFGTMFFEQPVAAFRNLQRMLRPGGELVMTTWRGLDENPWLAIAKRAALTLLPAPGNGAVSCGPGPFSLADPEVIREVLTRAGFCDVTLLPSDAITLVGHSLKSAVDFQMAIGPAGEIVREAGAAGEQRLSEVRAAIGEALAPFLCEEGVALPSAAWIVHAKVGSGFH